MKSAMTAVKHMTPQALFTSRATAKALAPVTIATRPISPKAAKLPIAVLRFFEEESLATSEYPMGSNSPEEIPPNMNAKKNKLIKNWRKLCLSKILR
jgi:hypothetical protein